MDGMILWVSNVELGLWTIPSTARNLSFSFPICQGDAAMSQDLRSFKRLSVRVNRVVQVQALIAFTVLFAAAMSIMFCALFLTGKTLIRITDGLDQHYPFFLYIGRWIRSSVRDFFTGKGLPGVWDMSFGYGTDMVVTLGAYLPDPFNWLSAFIPSKFSETGFVGTVILRLWFAGATFLVYCRYKKYDVVPSVIAALLYSTCGVTLVAPIESFFVNPMITFPLVIMGMQVVMDGGKPTLFICSLAATFALYFYFGYMACILLVPAYIGEAISRGWNLLGIVRRLLQFVGYSLVTVALSAVVLLPIVLVVAQTDRLGIERPLTVFYDLDYYRRLFAGFSSWASVGPDSDFGFGAVGVMSVIMLVVSKGRLSKKITLLIYTLFLLIPWFGKALNGLAYVANRWTWAYAFVVATIVASCLSSSFKLSQTRRRVACFLSIAYAAFMLYMAVFDAGAKSVNYLYLFSLIIFGMLLLSHAFLSSAPFGKHTLLAWYGVCCVAVVACSGIASTARFIKPSMPQLDSGTALSKMTTQSPYKVLLGAVPYDRETCDWRAENLMGGPMSQALINRVNSYDHYISIYNNRVDRLHTLLGLNGTQMNVQYRNLDRRFGLEYALGTRYMLDDGKHASSISSDFERIVTKGNANLWRSDSYRPIVSLCDRVVSTEEFLAASMAEREAMLSRAVVLDGEANATGSNLLAGDSFTEESFHVVGSSGVQVDGNTLAVNGKDSHIDFGFNAKKGRVFYAELVGCAFAPTEGTTGRTISFRNKDGTHIASLGLANPDDHMSGGKTDWVVNLGRYSEGEQVIRVTFSHPGTYRFKSTRLVSLSEAIVSQEHERSLASGDKVAMHYGKNQIECDVAASKDETLLITTPWSSGWSATVDGTPTEVQVADVAFMAIHVPEGEHKVTLRYRTPGLLAGAVITACGAAETVYLAKRKRTQPTRNAVYTDD